MVYIYLLLLKSLLILLLTKLEKLILKKNQKQQKNYTHQLLKNSKNVKFIQPLRTTFGVQI